MEEFYRGVWVVAYRQLLRFVQERSRLLSSFGIPLLLLVMLGAGFNRIVGPLAPGVDFVKFMYPGILAMTVLTTSLFSGLSVVWDKEFGFLKVVLVAPLSRSGVVLGKAVGSTIVAVGQGIIMLALAPVLGISLSPMLMLTLVPLLVILSLALSGLGILVASWMRSQQGFQVVMQLLVFPMIFLSGVFFPVNNVPLWLEVLAKINPVTYGVDAIRQLLLGGQLAAAAASVPGGEATRLGVTVFGHTMNILEDALVVGLLGLALMAAAVWSFNRQE